MSSTPLSSHRLSGGELRAIKADAGGDRLMAWGPVLSRRSWIGLAGAAVAGALAGCTSPARTPTSASLSGAPGAAVRTPITDAAAALAELRAGNQRFVDGATVHPHDSPEARRAVSTAQRPFAVVLGCSDSRVSPELIFDQGLGDLFDVRVAGNVVDPVGLGSIEYAISAFGTPLIVVLGHQNCGAVTATLKALDTATDPAGDIGSLISAIVPAVAVARQRPGDLLTNAVRANAEKSRDEILAAPLLQAPEGSGAVKVVTAYYSLDEGTVEFW
jgi:carbonic anhydrase